MFYAAYKSALNDELACQSQHSVRALLKEGGTRVMGILNGLLDQILSNRNQRKRFVMSSQQRLFQTATNLESASKVMSFFERLLLEAIFAVNQTRLHSWDIFTLVEIKLVLLPLSSSYFVFSDNKACNKGG